MLLHIDVVNKVATYQKRDGCIVCGNSGYKIEFNFDGEWNGVAKQAVLIVNGEPIYVDIGRKKMLFTNEGVIDDTGTVQTRGADYSDKFHSDIIPLADLVDGDGGYCVGHFDYRQKLYPKVLFFSDDNMASVVSTFSSAQIGNKETLTAAEIRELASESGATYVAFNSDGEDGSEDHVYYITYNGNGCECVVPVIRNADKIVVGVYSETAGMATTGTEIPCKKSILCT